MGGKRVDLSDRVREALKRHSRLRLETIGEDDYLARDLGFDSFALLNVVLDLEDGLGVEIDPARLSGLRDMTFRQLVALVAEHAGRVASS